MLLDSFRVCSRSQPRQALPPVLSTPPVLPPLFTTPDNEQPSSASAGPSDATALVLPFMRTVSPQKLIIGDFLPLPTIEASPICPSTAPFPTSTPAVEAFSSQDCTQSHSRMSLRVVFPPPTSTSTPPTPPRNTQKALIRDPQKPSHPVPPSASFPVSTTLPTPLAGPTNQLKRCLSCPAIVSRSQVFPLVSQSSHPQSPGVSGVHGRKRSKTVFHLPTDNGDSPVDERTISSLGPGLSRSTTGHVPAPSTSQNSSKDAIRIFYAVQELLMTEIDYVRDLRILFTAYIQQLPSFETRTPTFARTSPSFMSAPWANPAGQIGQFVGPFDGVVSSPSSISVKPVFSSAETELLARNLKDILHLHERFLSALRDVLSPLGVSGTPGSGYLPRDDPEAISTVISAIMAISEKFVSEASEFAIYKTFCAGHIEALDLLRRAMAQHPSEWDSFEQRCSATASEIYQSGSGIPSPVSARTQSGFSDVPTNSGVGLRRRRSTSTLPSEVKPSSSPIKFDTRQQKLTLSDYLIKPTQRICKYPLLLEQLKPKKSFLVPDDVRSASTNAIKAMRDVAASVDKAYHEREVSTRSSLIASRFVLPPHSLCSHSTKLPYSPLHSITPLFLSSLGDCLLAGSLDIMHSSPQRPFRDVSSITVKYLGAFLYPGGYLILAKVNKGKRYEPLHWFSIADFVVNDDGDPEVMLPHSFHLSSKDVHFELAAACQKEKDIWLQAIANSMKHEPIWSDVPLPSYTDIRRTPSGDSRTYTPTYANTPYTPGGSDTDSPEPPFHMDSRSKKLVLKKVDVTGPQEQPRSPSRHSSTTSIKSIFSPVGHDPNTIYINRSLISGRLQVENDLEDVASRACLDARKQAILHEEVLFPPPPGHHRETWSFSRSNSAISVANLAKSRLSRQESLRVPRRKTRCDSMTAFTPQSESTNFGLPPRGKIKRLSTPLPRQLLMTPIEPLQSSPATTSSLPLSISPQSLFSSVTTPSIPSTRCSSPVSRPSSPSSLMGHRHSRSLIRNVKGFFHTGPSPTSSLPPRHRRSDGGGVGRSPSLLGRWRDSVSRRRSRSAPNDDPRVLDT